MKGSREFRSRLKSSFLNRTYFYLRNNFDQSQFWKLGIKNDTNVSCKVLDFAITCGLSFQDRINLNFSPTYGPEWRSAFPSTPTHIKSIKHLIKFLPIFEHLHLLNFYNPLLHRSSRRDAHLKRDYVYENLEKHSFKRERKCKENIWHCTKIHNYKRDTLYFLCPICKSSFSSRFQVYLHSGKRYTSRNFPRWVFLLCFFSRARFVRNLVLIPPWILHGAARNRCTDSLISCVRYV